MNREPAQDYHMLPLSDNALDEMVARERERGAPPLTDWDSLSVRLRAEGLIREPVISRFTSKRWMSAGAPLLPARSVASASQPAPQPASPASAQSPTILASATEFKSPEDAWEVLNRAGEEYQRASLYLSASNTAVPMPDNPSQYRTRLAALDNVMAEIRGALKEAPQDPVINQYYLQTVGAREATLRQLGTTLRPAGVSLNRF
jgi:hypothetical protein